LRGFRPIGHADSVVSFNAPIVIRCQHTALDQRDRQTNISTNIFPQRSNVMSISSNRAQAIAEILWELKKAEKLATLTSIAARAGFAPGSNGRAVSTCLKTVRRDWPHLQWWRAIADNGQLEEEQRSHVAKAGFETETVEGGSVVIKSFASQLMNWEEQESASSRNSCVS
jgi:alkylated DNA nucleotide flippase Atl1